MAKVPTWPSLDLSISGPPLSQMPFRPPLSCPHSLPPSLSPLFFLSLFLLSVLALSLSLNQQMEMEVDKLEGVRQIPWSWGRRETDILVCLWKLKAVRRHSWGRRWVKDWGKSHMDLFIYATASFLGWGHLEGKTYVLGLLLKQYGFFCSACDSNTCWS